MIDDSHLSDTLAAQQVTEYRRLVVKELSSASELARKFWDPGVFGSQSGLRGWRVRYDPICFRNWVNKKYAT